MSQPGGEHHGHDREERALLLTLAHWALRLEGGVAADMGEDDHPNLKKFRDLIAVVEKGGDDKATGFTE